MIQPVFSHSLPGLLAVFTFLPPPVLVHFRSSRLRLLLLASRSSLAPIRFVAASSPQTLPGSQSLGPNSSASPFLLPFAFGFQSSSFSIPFAPRSYHPTWRVTHIRCIPLTIIHKINYIYKPFTCSIVIVPRHWHAHSIKKLEILDWRNN